MGRPGDDEGVSQNASVNWETSPSNVRRATDTCLGGNPAQIAAVGCSTARRCQMQPIKAKLYRHSLTVAIEMSPPISRQDAAVVDVLGWLDRWGLACRMLEF